MAKFPSSPSVDCSYLFPPFVWPKLKPWICPSHLSKLNTFLNNLISLHTPMAAAAKLTSTALLTFQHHQHRRCQPPLSTAARPTGSFVSRRLCISCKATDVSSSVGAEESVSGSDGNWVPVVPLAALPKGERRVIIQDGEAILLLWFKDSVFAIENRSPAEGAYTEGLINAKLTQDGCIVCPSTDSTFDLRTGAIKEWYPNNPVLRVLTPALRNLFIYPVKVEGENIFISIKGGVVDASAEIVFSGKAQPGVTATDVNIEEVRMVVDEEEQTLGFTGRNELINGKAAAIGFLLLLDFELLTGKGLLKGTGFLDFIYAVSNALK